MDDQVKQQSVNILIGEHYEINNMFDREMDEELGKLEQQFCTYEKLSLFLVTWNLNGKFPSDIQKVQRELLDFKGYPPTDIVVVSLQEMVQLNTKNVLMTNNAKITQQWQDLMLKVLSIFKNESYILIKEEDLVGIYLMIFIKSSIKTRVKKVFSDQVKTGLIGG